MRISMRKSKHTLIYNDHDHDHDRDAVAATAPNIISATSTSSPL